MFDTLNESIEKKLEKWEKFKDSLKKKDRKTFEKIINYAKSNSPQNVRKDSPIPFRPLVLSILLEQKKEIEKTRKQIEQLKNDIRKKQKAK